MSKIILADETGKLRPVIKILTDYPRDDLAHDEVHQALVTACMARRANAANIDVGAIPGMDTVVSGFKIAQLVMTSRMGFGHVFHVNCAPRKNIVSVKSAGEKIVVGMTTSGVALLAVNAGYTLSLFHDAAAAGDIVFFETTVPHAGSQFRSRDYFPDAVAELAVHLSTQFDKLGAEKIAALLAAGKMQDIFAGLSYIGAPLDINALPQMPQGTVMYIDNFGNMKLNYVHPRLFSQYASGDVLVVAVGNAVAEATVGDVGFSHGEGVLALTAGSSGWCEQGAFSELFLRGGRAESHFPGVRPGDQVAALSKADFQRVLDTLAGADRAVSDKLDLHNVSEARIIRKLAKAGLIRNGFDVSALRHVLGSEALLEKLSA